jgi:hypothetical protein
MLLRSSHSLLWFKYGRFPTVLYVVHLVSSWLCCLGGCENFRRWDLLGGSRSLGTSSWWHFLPGSFQYLFLFPLSDEKHFSTTCFHHLDVLPKCMSPRFHGLDPLGLWTKRSPLFHKIVLLKHFVTAKRKETNTENCSQRNQTISVIASQCGS